MNSEHEVHTVIPHCFDHKLRALGSLTRGQIVCMMMAGMLY